MSHAPSRPAARRRNPLGSLPDCEVSDLPAPPPYTLRNLLKIVGPGAILLAGSIGGGEWLIGPAVAAKYGAGLFWIATVAIGLQLLFNLEAVRYTLYSGEPALTGMLRIWPGSKLWAGLYILLAVLQLGVPALAASCAGVLISGWAGEQVAQPEPLVRLGVIYAVMFIAVGILLSGKSIERVLEKASWGMILFIFGFLVVVNVLYVPADHWRQTAAGFVSFGYLPEDFSFWTAATLIGALAATSGSGGIGNLVISNWMRDKGFGMGAKVGAISGLFGESEVRLSRVGVVFPVTEQNLRHWRQWWKYVRADQIWLWAMGCFVGMFLNVNLATAIMPEGLELSGDAVGTYQAHYLAKHFWSGFWLLALLNGFWILFSTHLGNTDTLVRAITDILWVAGWDSPRLQRIYVSRLYFLILALLTLWGMFAVNWSDAMNLFKLLGNIAGLVLALGALHLLVVNRTLLPRALQPRWWQQAGLVACMLFYGFFATCSLGSEIWKRLKPWQQEWVQGLFGA